MSISDTYNFFLILRKAAIMNSYFLIYLAVLLYIIIEIKLFYYSTFCQVVNPYFTVTFNYHQIITRIPQIQIYYRILHFYLLYNENITLISLPSLICQNFMLPSYPADIA